MKNILKKLALLCIPVVVWFVLRRLSRTTTLG